jgi:hypothetical protein
MKRIIPTRPLSIVSVANDSPAMEAARGRENQGWIANQVRNQWVMLHFILCLITSAMKKWKETS